MNNRKFSSGIYFILISFLVLCNSLYSHTIITKDLKVYYGNVNSMDGQFVIFSSEKGLKKIRKDIVGKIIIQEIEDEAMLKKFLKKVKEANPNYVAPSESAPPPPPSTKIDDIEFENAKNLLREIEEEEKTLALKEKASSALRASLLFPGRGEHMLENRKTGIFYGSIFLVSLGGLAHSQNLFLSSQKNYQEIVSQNVQLAYTLYNPFFSETKSVEFYAYSQFQQQSAYQELQDAGKLRNSLAVLPVLIYALQFVHTYWNVHSLEVDKKVNVEVGIIPIRENPLLEQGTRSWGGSLSIRYRF